MEQTPERSILGENYYANIIYTVYYTIYIFSKTLYGYYYNRYFKADFRNGRRIPIAPIVIEI